MIEPLMLYMYKRLLKDKWTVETVKDEFRVYKLKPPEGWKIRDV